MSKKLYEVKLTQFIRPDGRPYEVATSLPLETAPLYIDMMKAGFIFTLEEDTPGIVTVSISGVEGDVDHRTTRNGIEADRGMVEMLLAGLWKKKEEADSVC